MARRSPADQEWSAYPARTIAAIGLVFFLALASASTMLVSPPVGGPDVTEFERRLAALREALPQRGVLGYVSDTGWVGDFYLTQYALAPIVLSGSAPLTSATPGQAAIVGYVNSPAAIADVLARNGLVVTRNFGGGVLLLEPKARH